MNYLLDTNIVLTCLRTNELSQRLTRQLELFAPNVSLLVSIVTVGELQSIAKQNNWGEKRTAALLEWLNTFLVLDINIEEVVEQYAKIDAFSQGKLKELPSSFSSRNMGKNDVWIAATASVFDLKLITTDKDFYHLDEVFLDLTLVDLNALENSK